MSVPTGSSFLSLICRIFVVFASLFYGTIKSEQRGRKVREMFPESILTKIFDRPDVCMIPMQYQSAMIQAIGEVLDEEGVVINDADAKSDVSTVQSTDNVWTV